MNLSTNRLYLGYDGRLIVEDLNLSIAPGQISVLIGPNGCGKSTILRSLARLLPPRQGSVLLDGKMIQHLPTKVVAKKLAILPQMPQAPEGLSVEQLVWFGRYPYQSALGGRTQSDREAVEWALAQTGMTVFASRALETLSGGQRQRAWIAMALAQQTPILLLDEPTTYLDLSHQLEVLHLLVRLNREEGKTVVMVLHDLNQASRFAHQLIVVNGGRVVAQGLPEEVLNEQILREVFGLKAHFLQDPETGRPYCIPYALARKEPLIVDERVEEKA
ncbi:ABC transporter ATP-binding protein [Meiothermus taiwanensis]|jgi:iron complex transport system ATP-binding protein|uniref:ABC transporter related protein n=1 Tax=Meiothermus taiwanensis WR-220 TaxID=1339250 RepID=A0ABM6WJW9_9DEIN|nr:ABC transporter ATP-binding protein [Meiothermus taiwanensis]AWR87265.1 ABC transporter related protein [Meiothermus taiwanensis WR-220]KIQ54057.1 iron-dicitrate transporter ATP-binding subunit [Meiothermus taiwanensis]KZK16871.1 iron-dicitrate transporter ATP-binding subunit [Meiothermus taiwanensis]